MSVDLFVQLFVNGLMSGGMYALVASGFTLILGVIQVFNFAQGDFYMLGAFITFGMMSVLGLPYPLAILAALAGIALLGVLFHTAVLRRTMVHGFFHTLLVTVAFGTLINQTALLSFGFREGVVSPVFPGTLAMGNITLNPG